MLSLTSFLNILWGEVFDVFIQIIPNFYSSKANIEFTIVGFDRVDIISWSGSKPGFVLVNWRNRLEKKYERKMAEGCYDTDPQNVHFVG